MTMPLSERVECCVLKTIKEFQRNPEHFLTESDLKCRLFMELNNDALFSQEEFTEDKEKKTNYVHSESSYFVFGKLNKKRVDLTVVKPSNYNFENEKVVYRKGYSFSEPSIGIELKLNKSKPGKTMRKELEKVLNDLRKLKNTRPESDFYLLLLDKRRLFSEKDISELKSKYHEIKVFYGATIEQRTRTTR